MVRDTLARDARRAAERLRRRVQRGHDLAQRRHAGSALVRHFASQRCATKPKPVNKIIFLSSRRRSPLYVNPKNRRVYLNQAHALALMKTGSLAGHTRYAEDAPPIAKDRATGRLSAVASGADRWVFPLYLRTVYAKHGNRHPRAAATTLDPRLRREFDTWLQRRRP